MKEVFSKIKHALVMSLISIFIFVVFILMFPRALISVGYQVYNDLKQGKKVTWW